QHAIIAADRGENAVIFAFDENSKLLENRIAALGMPIEKHLKSQRICVQQVDPAELSPGQFSHIVVQAVEKRNARVVIIDSLNGYLNAIPNEKFLPLHLHELLAYLSQNGVVSIMTVAQHGLVGPMQAPVDVTYLADTVILLRFFEAHGRVRKAISVIKKRSGGHEDTIREFKMNKKGIQIGEPLEEFQGVLTGIPAFHGKSAQMLGGS
ncbi:MAG: ATPase domain-containing protein, partial [Verrucomicrobiota bacterium]